MVDSNKIFTTGETKSLVGEDVIDFLQSQKIKPDVIISKQDFEYNSLGEYISNTAQLNHALIQAGIVPTASLKESLSRYASEDNLAYSIPIKNTNLQHDDILKEVGYDDGTIKENSDDISHIITYPNIDSPAKNISFTAHIPEDQLSPLVHNLSLKDFRTHILFHEVGHTDPKQHSNPDMSRAERELNADIYANDLYKKAFAKGIVSDPNIPEVFSYMRAIASVMGKRDIDYAYNGTVDPDENVNHIHIPEAEHEQPPTNFLNNSIGVIYTSIGKLTQDIETEFATLSLIEINEEDLPPEQIEEYRRLQSLEEPPLDEIEDFMATVEIPEEKQARYNASLQALNIMEGYRMAKDQPELVYETAKRELVNGRFDDDPATKNLIENFVIGAERIAPDHFKIEGTPYLDYLKTIGRDENLTSGLTVPYQQMATSNELSSSYTL